MQLSRTAVLALLEQGPMTAAEIRKATGASRDAVNGQLLRLREAGLAVSVGDCRIRGRAADRVWRLARADEFRLEEVA